jgi:hypothetical protein
LPFYTVRHPVRVAALSVIAYPVKRRTPTRGAGREHDAERAQRAAMWERVDGQLAAERRKP